jgi:hypothetical protein
MANQIVDAGGVNLLKVNSTGSAQTVLYDGSGNLLGTAAKPIYTNANTSIAYPGTVGTYAAASWRTVGVAATNHVLMTVRNNSGSLGIAIRRVAVDINYSAAAAFMVQGYFRLWPNTGVTPSGGAAPTKHSMDTSCPSSQAATEILFASSADGTAATITHATPGGTPAREQGHGNILTAVGAAFNVNDYELINYAQAPMIIRSGQTACLILVTSANNITSQHYTVKVVWDEFTL